MCYAIRYISPHPASKNSGISAGNCCLCVRVQRRPQLRLKFYSRNLFLFFLYTYICVLAGGCAPRGREPVANAKRLPNK